MHSSILFLGLLSASAFALPGHLESKRQADFAYSGPLGESKLCPSVMQVASSGKSFVAVGAPPNYPNYMCIPWSSETDWVSIDLGLSNSTALMVYSDKGCRHRVSFIEPPGPASGPNVVGVKGGVEVTETFCASQTQNGGAWRSVMYTQPEVGPS